MKFDTAVQALCDEEAEFIIIGGWSAILHGSAHLTKDLDIFFSRRTDNLKRITRALAPFHPRLRDLPPGLPFVFDEATLRNCTVVALNTDLGSIDLLAEVAGLGSFEQVAADAVQVEAFGRTIRTLDLESLLEAEEP